MSRAQLEDVRLSYDGGLTWALDGVSLRIEPGERICVLGPNGSGKSSLAQVLAGLVAPDEGTVELAGLICYDGSPDPDAYRHARRVTGLVFQNPRLQFLALTVAEEVLVTLRSANPGTSEEELAARVPALLDEFALSGLAERSPYEISQGQQRRLAMLSMLAGAADVLLLDEPTYAQDERSTRLMLDMLMGRVAAGLTVVMATHDLTLARAIANKVLRVEDGRVREISRDELTRFERSLEGVGER